MKGRWAVSLFLVSGGIILALNLSHRLFPLRSPLFEVGGEWIGTKEGLPRGYFRHTFDLPFTPKQAWLRIAADDYQVYINGVDVASNIHIVNSSLAFQGKLLPGAQRVTLGRVFEMQRAPELQKRANEEWRIAQMYDITDYLRIGRNTIAVYAQSDRSNRFSVEGAVEGKPGRIDIPGAAEAWRASPLADTKGGKHWYDLEMDDTSWPHARSLGRIEKPIFITSPPEIWTRLFSPEPITAEPLEDGVRLRMELPPADRTQVGWIRILSNWSFTLLVGDDVVGEGGANRKVEAFDLSVYMGRKPKQLNLFMRPPESGNQTVPWIAADGQIGSFHFSGGAGWETLTKHHPQWLRGEGAWHAARPHGVTFEETPIRFRIPAFLDLSWTKRFFFLSVILTLLLAALLFFIRQWARRSRFHDVAEKVPYWLLTPPILGVGMLELARIRFQESDTVVLFLDPAYQNLWILVGPALLFLSTIVVLTPWSRSEDRSSGTERVLLGKPLLWLCLIMALGFSLRYYNISFEDLQADENVSWDAARGILRTGAPEAVSGVFYTRSPLYHYLLAGWLALFGNTLRAARTFSLIPGVGVIAAVYFLMVRITGRRSLGLITAFLVAVDPWEIHVSRIIRFYQQMQFFSVLSMLYFLRGFVWKEGKRYQNAFFFCCAAAVLSQEVFVTVFPAFGIGFLIFYRPFDWKADRNVWIGFITLMVITGVDIAVFSIRCLTQHVGVGTSSGSIMQLHLFDVLAYSFTFFAGNNRAHLFYSLLFFLGIFYWLKRPNAAVWMLYGMVGLTLFTLTVLVIQIASRYFYSIYPYLIGISVMTADALIREASTRLFPLTDTPIAILKRRWTALAAASLLVVAVSNVEFGKLADSYSRHRNLQHLTAFNFIREQKQPEDKVMSVYPMPAAIVLGGIDYYLVGFISFDEVYLDRIGPIDRWAGGKLVSKADQIRALFQQHKRLWIVIDEEESKKISADLLAFIRQTSTVQYAFFGGEVFLWDKEAGIYAPFPEKGGESDSY